MKKVILYIHGKGGSYLEAEQYKKNCIGFDIIGIDFNEYLPWIVQNQIQLVYNEARERYDYIYVIANISEKDLCEKGEIPTDFGETLSWKYLCFVRENPITWNVPTEILYAGNDNLISRQTINEFVSSHNAHLTVMENGEHWFHTDEQLAFLDVWMKKAID